jgi:prepilin peptidase CpaA
MARLFELLALAGFGGLMMAAAASDFCRLVIPNRVVVALCLLWPLHEGARGAAPGAIVATLGCAAAVLAAGALLFARGMVGGGDVKLLAAASLWVGAAAVPALLTATALLGGVMALAFLTPLARLGAAGRARAAESGGAAFGAVRNPIPYGVAIAGAALAVTMAPLLA